VTRALVLLALVCVALRLVYVFAFDAGRRECSYNCILRKGN
jgi:hypothetical protein